MKKIALCEQAEDIQHDTDWKRTTERLIKLQKDWKGIGSAPRSEENKLWERFRAACDTFFNAKREFFETIDARQEANMGEKEALIERINAVTFGEDRAANIQLLKDFSNEWNQIGFVPMKDKNRIYKAYHEALDANINCLKLMSKNAKLPCLKVA